VPNTTGLSLTDARNALAAAGYTQINPVQVPGQQGTPCTVLGTQPAAGTPADPATTSVFVGLPNNPGECQ
jgi:beta-lactam-binding protein with PASTA domain